MSCNAPWLGPCDPTESLAEGIVAFGLLILSIIVYAAIRGVVVVVWSRIKHKKIDGWDLAMTLALLLFASFIVVPVYNHARMFFDAIAFAVLLFGITECGLVYEWDYHQKKQHNKEPRG